MFTIDQIEQAHAKVKSGADFPNYIQEIKALGVSAFETWVYDSHTVYFGANNMSVSSEAKYSKLPISGQINSETFKIKLKNHQNGETDYYTFCKDCAETGVEKWVVNLAKMTCIYYDKQGGEILEEKIPQL